MKIVDRMNIKDKNAEKTIRDVDNLIEHMSVSNILNKGHYIEIQSLTLELLITVFKRLDNNRSPAKTLLEFTGAEVIDACLRVGPSKVFEDDAEYVIAVMQELTK